MAFTDGLIVMAVLFGLFILAYCGMTKKSLLEVWKEFVAMIKGE